MNEPITIQVDKIIYESHNFLLRTRKDGKYVIFNKHTEGFYIVDDEKEAIFKLIMLAEDFIPNEDIVQNADTFLLRSEQLISEKN